MHLRYFKRASSFVAHTVLHNISLRGFVLLREKCCWLSCFGWYFVFLLIRRTVFVGCDSLLAKMDVIPCTRNCYWQRASHAMLLSDYRSLPSYGTSAVFVHYYVVLFLMYLSSTGECSLCGNLCIYEMQPSPKHCTRVRCLNFGRYSTAIRWLGPLYLYIWG